MITTRSNGYWTTGITVVWTERAGGVGRESRPGWAVSLNFLDDDFCDDDADAGRISTEGRLHTRYSVRDGETVSGLTAAIDTLLADALRLGIVFRDPQVYYRGDGEHPDYPPPADWRTLLNEQAERIGWTTPYGAKFGTGAPGHSGESLSVLKPADRDPESEATGTRRVADQLADASISMADLNTDYLADIAKAASWSLADLQGNACTE